jgi:hypothetical protein
MLTSAGINLEIKVHARLAKLYLHIQIEGLRNGLSRILESPDGVEEEILNELLPRIRVILTLPHVRQSMQPILNGAPGADLEVK